MSGTATGSRQRSRTVLLTSLAIDNFGSGLFLPLPVLYAVSVVRLDAGKAGVAISLAGMLGFVVPPAAGRLAHRFGPLTTVVTAQMLQAAGAATYLLVPTLLGVLFAAGLMSIGVQMFYCSVFVLVSDMSQDDATERSFARVAMVRSAAFGLGGLTSGVALGVGGPDGLRWLVAVDALTFVVAALLLARGVTAVPGRIGAVPTTSTAVFRDRRYLTLMTAGCLLDLTVGVALLGTPVLVIESLRGPSWLPGVLLGMGTVLSAVYAVRVVDLLRVWTRTRAMQLGGAAYVAFGALFAAAVTLPGGWLVPYLVATWVLFVLGSKAFYPMAGALSEALPPRASRTQYMATYQFAFTTAQALSPAIVGLTDVAAWLPWVVTAGAAAIAIALLQHLQRRLPSELNRPPAVPV